jgi:PAS domain S-box-containing protein
VRSLLPKYALAIGAVALALGLQLLLAPLLHDRAPFVTFLAAVILTKWYAGRGPALLALALGMLGASWLVLKPPGVLSIGSLEYQVGVLLYLGVGYALIAAIAWLRQSQERLRITLASIGEAVISTDAQGCVTFLNPVAERLTGWSRREAEGRRLGEVFHSVDESSRLPREDPVARALRPGQVAAPSNHAILIARDGTERPIDESAAPIRARDGRLVGCVLVFRDLGQARQTERRYRQLVEQSADGIFVSTPDGRYEDVNPAGAEILGMTREEVLRHTIMDVLDPADVPRLAPAVAELADGGVHVTEWRFRRKDGSSLIGEVTARQLPDGRLQGVLRDVTARRQAEQERADSAATMAQLVAGNPFGVYLVDADFRLAVVSRGAQKTFANVHPLIGRDFAEVLRVIWPEPFATEAVGRFRRTLETGEPYEAPGTVEHRADIDAVEAYDWRIERVRLPDGRFGVVCYFYDLSERQNWERRLAAATDASEVGVHQWHILQNSVWWDRRVREWWGVGPDVPITYEIFLAGVHPDDHAVVNESVRKALDPAGPGRLDAEYRAVVPGRPPRWVRATGQADFVDGVAVTLTGGVLDITRERERELALRARDQRKDLFLATLSHELRNPLAPIRSAAEMLAHEGLTQEQAVSAQRIISRQSLHLARLLDDLLDVSRVTQGKMVLRREPVPLGALVDAALETARPQIDAKRHVLHVALPSRPPMLYVDPHRMAQVLSNLLSNAARYTEPGGRIDLSVEEVVEQVVVTVRDTGIGLPPDALATIFDMFAQVESRDREHDGGLGIGLALVRGLVELHGGTVVARSAGRGKGAEFTVTLPRSAVATTTGSTAEGATAVATAVRVLVADDNRDAADSLAELLRLAGHEVRVAYDGRTALSVARPFRPDVMLLDLGMPNMSGYEVAAQVREEPWGRDVCLVAVTGWGQAADRADTTAVGFHEHLVKPVDFAELRALLARVAVGVCTDRRQPRLDDDGAATGA